MDDTERRPLIGKETWRDGLWRDNGLGQIASHLHNEHLITPGFHRDGAWTGLHIDPETGLYWESQRLQSGLQGGGAISLIPLSTDDVKRKYASFPARGLNESVELSSEDRFSGVASYEQGRILRIIQHMATKHLLSTDAEAAPANYTDPTDGTKWQVERSDKHTAELNSPIRITQLSVEEGGANG